MEIVQESLNEVNYDAEILKCVLTGDATWIYQYDIETKAHSSQWTYYGSRDQKRLDKCGTT
jgi:hypothetical protein